MAGMTRCSAIIPLSSRLKHCQFKRMFVAPKCKDGAAFYFLMAIAIGKRIPKIFSVLSIANLFLIMLSIFYVIDECSETN